MTDNEIIKALKCCGNIVDSTCKECVYHETYNASCVVRLMRDALDLINRQKAEIENLNIVLQAMRNAANSYKAENERYKGFIKLLEADVKTAKSEAIKEFAEKVKDLFYPEDEVREEINNLAQEMVGNADV